MSFSHSYAFGIVVPQSLFVDFNEPGDAIDIVREDFPGLSYEESGMSWDDNAKHLVIVESSLKKVDSVKTIEPIVFTPISDADLQQLQRFASQYELTEVGAWLMFGWYEN